ncbi:hypothetical protein JNUCC64_02765 [Streptomyces sp. JNUCC 64]
MTPPHRRSVVLMFPGTGAQHPRMAAGLYGHEAVFTEAVDAVLALLGPVGDAVRADWLAGEPAGASGAEVRRAAGSGETGRSPSARGVRRWSVRPVALTVAPPPGPARSPRQRDPGAPSVCGVLARSA